MLCKRFPIVHLLLRRMFKNRVPHMLQEDYTPLSGLYIAMKDLVRAIHPLVLDCRNDALLPFCLTPIN